MNKIKVITHENGNRYAPQSVARKEKDFIIASTNYNAMKLVNEWAIANGLDPKTLKPRQGGRK